jgi:hypothetical protein
MREMDRKEGPAAGSDVPEGRQPSSAIEGGPDAVGSLGTSEGAPMATDIDALNYPYIRVRDVDWLKRTLLIFPHVVRMTPDFDPPPDSAEVSEFGRLKGRRGPLLRSAELSADHVRKAQEDLIEAIRNRIGLDRESFLSTYGRSGTLRAADSLIRQAASPWDDRLLGRPFQIHSSKILGELGQFIRGHNLAWRPDDPHGHGYIETHPRLGEAVMATLAFACAENEGLQLVTEFPGLYERTIRLPKENLLDSCLSSAPRAVPGLPSVAEFIVYQ